MLNQRRKNQREKTMRLKTLTLAIFGGRGNIGSAARASTIRISFTLLIVNLIATASYHRS